MPIFALPWLRADAWGLRIEDRRSKIPNGFVRLLVVLALTAPLVRAAETVADLPALWAERVKSVVAIEYVNETEVDRQTTISMGTVIDDQGTVILLRDAIDPQRIMNPGTLA